MKRGINKEKIKLTLSTIEVELIEWHLPIVWLLQSPNILPKLANKILEIFLLRGQWSSILGLLPCCFMYESTKGGLVEDIWPQTFVIETLSIDMPIGFPLSSSNTTTKLSLGFKNDLGMWYLRKTKLLIHLENAIYYQELKPIYACMCISFISITIFVRENLLVWEMKSNIDQCFRH